MKPYPLHVHDDGTAYIGNCRVRNGYPAVLLLGAAIHPTRQMKRGVEGMYTVLGRLEGISHQPRFVLGRTPAGEELAVLITLDDALLVPRPDLL